MPQLPPHEPGHADWASRLQDYMRAQVPLARAMQVEVASIDADWIRLRAPLALNDNHKGTAFGGSQYALAALAGWGLLVVTLWREQLAGEIVIRDGEIRYLAAVRDDLELTARTESSTAMDEFLDQYRRQRLARITLLAEIGAADAPAMRFRGHYVAGV